MYGNGSRTFHLLSYYEYGRSSFTFVYYASRPNGYRSYRSDRLLSGSSNSPSLTLSSFGWSYYRSRILYRVNYQKNCASPNARGINIGYYPWYGNKYGFYPYLCFETSNFICGLCRCRHRHFRYS